VRVGSNKSVRVINAILLEYALGEILEVDLMNDSNSRRDHLEGLECLHAPFEKFIAFAIPLELDFHVPLKRVRAAPEINLNRMINDQVNGHERLDEGGIFTESSYRGTHCREVYEQWNPGKILEYDAGDDKRNLGRSLGCRLPVGKCTNVIFFDFFSVTIPKNRFENDSNAYWKSRDRADACLL
jgi:hypothetical protein